MKNELKEVSIKSGVDINSKEFKEYYEHVKNLTFKNKFLNIAVKENSKVLTSPIVFNGKDYKEINIDDMSFVWFEDRIIGHTLYNIKKIKFSIPITRNSKNYLDERLFDIDGRFCFSKIEQFLVEDIELDDLLYSYLKDRINGKTEKTGIVEYEKDFTKQKN